MFRVVGTTILVVAAAALGGLLLLEASDDRTVASIWQELDQTPSTGRVFSPGMVATLPEPAQRYFRHAIQPGTPLAARVHVVQTGSLRFGTNWVPVSAEQVLVPGRGFVWKADSQVGPLPISATDHYASGQGRMRIAALGLVPFINATGPDLSRSAIGRLVGETMWLPSGWLPQAGARIEPVDDDRFAVLVTVGDETTRLVLTVNGEGRLLDIMFPRYGNQTPDQHYQYIPFGGPIDEEGTFGGYTIPTRIRAGWWYGTEQYQETFRLQITAATFE